MTVILFNYTWLHPKEGFSLFFFPYCVCNQARATIQAARTMAPNKALTRAFDVADFGPFTGELSGVEFGPPTGGEIQSPV